LSATRLLTFQTKLIPDGYKKGPVIAEVSNWTRAHLNTRREITLAVTKPSALIAQTWAVVFEGKHEQVGFTLAA
jgi:hypothetical protein